MPSQKCANCTEEQCKTIANVKYALTTCELVATFTKNLILFSLGLTIFVVKLLIQE